MNRHRLSILVLLVIALLAATTCAGCIATGDEMIVPDDGLREGLVVRVVDGDTAHITIDGVKEKVRFIGIDTPESTREHEPYGKEASAYAHRLLDNRRVWVETDAELRDDYGRLLAYIWLERPDADGDPKEQVRTKQYNARAVLDGYAQIYTFPPNTRYVELLLECQREARGANRGLWAVPGAADDLTGKRSERVPSSSR